MDQHTKHKKTLMLRVKTQLATVYDCRTVNIHDIILYTHTHTHTHIHKTVQFSLPKTTLPNSVDGAISACRPHCLINQY